MAAPLSRRSPLPAFLDIAIPSWGFDIKGFLSINLRSRSTNITPQSIGSTALKLGAVQTANIAFGAVTPARQSRSARTFLWLGDETSVQGTAGSFTTKKNWTLIKSGTAGANYGTIRLLYQLRRPTGSAGSVQLKVRLNGSNAFSSPYINSGSFSILSGSFRTGQLLIGSQIAATMQIRSSVTTATAYQQIVELYGQQDQDT